MATGYTPTKKTTNFAKFSWIIVDVCRDVMFDIVSLEIAPIDIPKKIRATPQKVKLYPEQKKSICNKPGGAAPNNEDFDIPSLYTVLRNLCCIQPPTRRWFDNTLQNHPLPADVRVSDDVERLRNKRNALFGHIKRAEMSDSDFQKEISEIKQILTRLDNHLGKHYVDAVTKIETCCMDPEKEQKYIKEVEEQLKKDTETRELLEIEQKKISEIREKVQKLTVSHDQERILHEQTRADVAETRKDAFDMKDNLKQHTILYERTQEETKKVLVELQVEQKQVRTLHERTQESVRQLEAENQEFKEYADEQLRLQKENQESIAGAARLLELQVHLQQLYNDDGTLRVSVIPSHHDIQLSQVFAPIIIRKDLEDTNPQGGQQTSGFWQHQDAGQTTKGLQHQIGSYRDMFFRKDELQKNIYLLGQAGSGKTTFCHHLVDVWCGTPNTARFANVGEITNFEYVFLVSCRHAESSDTILNMILNQLFDSDTEHLLPTVRHVLKTRPDKCLILVDGLDEWAGSPSKSTGPRSPCGLPNKKGVENCVVLTTSRPWRIEALRQGLGKPYRILEIQGLADSNVEKLAKNLLFALEEPDIIDRLKEFMAAVHSAKMKEMVKNPLMLIIVITVWLARNKLDKSQCVNFSGIIEYLIEIAEGQSGRTHDANKLAKIAQLPKLKVEWAKQDIVLPQCFHNMQFSEQFAPLIEKLSKFAFDALFNEIQEKALVFSMGEMEKVFSKPELEIYLTIGLLSLASAPIRSVKRMVKASFLHKKLQEFLAAMWMASDAFEHCLAVFKSHCKSLSGVLDYSQIVVFVCGLSPDRGRELWRCIVEVTEADPLVKEYRQTVAAPYNSVRHDYNATRSIIRLQELALESIAEAKHSMLGLSDGLEQLCTLRDIYVEGHGVNYEALTSPSYIRSCDRVEYRLSRC